MKYTSSLDLLGKEEEATRNKARKKNNRIRRVLSTKLITQKKIHHTHMYWKHSD